LVDGWRTGPEFGLTSKFLKTAFFFSKLKYSPR
jgi:hypothetical protein